MDRHTQLNQLMTEYGGDVVNLAFAYVKDRVQAEDIAQDVFLRVYRNLDQFQHKSSVKTWIFSITMNCAKDYLRSSSFRRLLLRENPLDAKTAQNSSSAEDEAFDSFEKKLLWEAVFQLPVKYREVLVLFYREELSIAEIAELVGQREGTVRTRLKRARNMLEQRINREVIDLGTNRA